MSHGGCDIKAHCGLSDQEFTMKTTCVQIPTYDPDRDDAFDYSRMHTLTLQHGSGLRIVMGDPDDESVPDVLIERTADLWRMFIHPACTDPICIIEIGDTHVQVETDKGVLLLERPY
jgi:hypothetical protein